LPQAESDRSSWQSLLRLAVPSVAAGWLKAGFALADTLVAGRLSTEDLAGLSAATFFVWMFYSLSQANSVGALSKIAQAWGARDLKKVRGTFRLAFFWALLAGTALSLVLALAGRWIMAHLSLSPPVAEAAMTYLAIVLVGGPFFWVLDTLEQSFRAMGDARTPLWVTGASVGLNLILNPLLAFGIGSFSGWGIKGIAAATVIAWVGGALSLTAIGWRRGYFGKGPSPSTSPLSLWRIGLPTALSMVTFDLIWVALTPLLARAGDPVLGAVSVGHRLEALGYLTGAGIGAATASLVGQAMGANRPDQIRAVAKRSAGLVLGTTGLWTAFIVIAAGPLYAIFTPDPAVQAAGAVYLLLAAAWAPLQALEVVMAGAFAGLGRTFVPMALTITAYGLRIPAAYLFFDAFAERAIFIAIGLTCGLAGLSVTGAFVLLSPGDQGVVRRGARPASLDRARRPE
jgi:putative MATE family efflux protein